MKVQNHGIIARIKKNIDFILSPFPQQNESSIEPMKIYLYRNKMMIEMSLKNIFYLP